MCAYLPPCALTWLSLSVFRAHVQSRNAKGFLFNIKKKILLVSWVKFGSGSDGEPGLCLRLVLNLGLSLCFASESKLKFASLSPGLGLSAIKKRLDFIEVIDTEEKWRKRKRKREK